MFKSYTRAADEIPLRAERACCRDFYTVPIANPSFISVRKECKGKLRIHRCYAYKENRGTCSIHFIREVVLRETMLDLIKRVALFIQQYSSICIPKKHSLTKAVDMRNMKAEIERNKRRIAEINTMIEGLYEANVPGKINDERFSKMMEKYETRQNTLVEENKKLECALEQAEQDKVDLRVFLETIRKCTDIKELTPALVNRLIHRIEVQKSENVDRRKRVKLDVYFTAAGLIDIHDEKELHEMMEEISRSA